MERMGEAWNLLLFFLVLPAVTGGVIALAVWLGLWPWILLVPVVFVLVIWVGLIFDKSDLI